MVMKSRPFVAIVSVLSAMLWEERNWVDARTETGSPTVDGC
jgi:hypothetical protein